MRSLNRMAGLIFGIVFTALVTAQSAGAIQLSNGIGPSSQVPEPTGVLLFAAGAVIVAYRVKKRRQQD